MSRRFMVAFAAICTLGGVAVVDSGVSAGGRHQPPRGRQAEPGPLLECDGLASFTHPGTVITGAAVVPAGAISYAGTPIDEHCVATGYTNERVSPVDGQTYRIGFEMRLPNDWSGRYLYQGNGGIDGFVRPAVGAVSGASLSSGLQMGMAVISSDAGHDVTQLPLFGLDPQARLDYGYQAVGTLTPMAKSLIEAAYGRGPDYSYIGGGSNGGRHTMVAAARYPDEYDGFLAVSPGFNLPKAAVAQLWGAQQWAKVATTTADLETAFTEPERQLVADTILQRCDRLDRLVDGMVQDIDRCQRKFDIDRHVPTCTGARDGTCLTADQKQVVTDVFDGAVNSAGTEIYNSFPFDPGIATDGWAGWKFQNSVGDRRDPPAVGFIFSTPPADTSILADTLGYALNYDMDTDAPAIYATNELYTESAIEFMTPPNATRLDGLRREGGKMVVVHGGADGVFSLDDTTDWYDELDQHSRNRADEFVRLFRVPGMGHVAGGPATDQFDGLSTLVDWVEYGAAPDRIVASVRAEANPDLPADWSADRTRPLCPYPQVARYVRGDTEDAASFRCQRNGDARGQ